MNNKRKIIIWVIILVLVFVIFLISKMVGPLKDLYEPVKLLDEKVSSLNRFDLTKINNKYKEILESKQLLDDDLLYLSEANSLDNDIYKGRFVSSEGYTYQFTINTKTLDVKIIEIAKIQIDREESLGDHGGIDNGF